MNVPRNNHLLKMGVPMLLLLAVGSFLVLFFSGSSKVSAQPSGGTECNVVVALDKSPSIGESNLAVLNDNITRLVDMLSLEDKEINIAFWAFSHSDDSSIDFNLPRHDYISTMPNPDVFLEFENSLPKFEDLEGQTDYAQAYGYSAGEPDVNVVPSIEDLKSQLVSNSRVSSIRSIADVVVLLTDGAPNFPGNSDNNQVARNAGRAAREMFDSNVVMIGAYITDQEDFIPGSLNYTINGSDTDGTRVGPVSYDGEFNEQIYSFVLDKLKEACNIERQDYWLRPVAGKNVETAQTGDNVSFSYYVDKDSDSETTKSSAWQIFDVTIDPEVEGDPLEFGIPGGYPPGGNCSNNEGNAYCNNVGTCAAILAKINNQGTCREVPAADRGSGTTTFSAGQNDFYDPDRTVTVGDYPLGTRVCSMLVLRNASGSGATNRGSSAACVVIAKAPVVQVHGGDIRVGRHFVKDITLEDGSDEEDEKKAGVYTSRFKISQDESIVPNGRTFGSWVEYGVLAPGPIMRIASLSGFAGEYGGYDGAVDTSSCDGTLNRLTFANIVEDDSRACGHYKGDIGAIPDVVSALTTGAVINAGSYSQPLEINGSSPDSTVGRYEDNTEGANFTIGRSELEANKTYIVYVPKGTVTITDDIIYADPSARYSDIRTVPQLIIIAKDINIRENVTQVNAWLVAAGDGNEGGKIDTCTGYTGRLSSENCNQLLTINGPIMARDLHLWRTKVQADSCRIEVIEDCSETGAPAEIMNLSGSSILWTKGYNENSARARTANTIELPPYF